MDFYRVKEGVLRDYANIGISAVELNRQQLESLSNSQRALIAIALLKQGKEKLTFSELARRFEVTYHTIQCASKVIDNATAEELQGVENNLYPARRVYNRLVKQEKGEVLKSKTVSNDKYYLESKVFKQLKDGLIMLGSLPNAEDVVRIAARLDSRNNNVDKNLENAVNFLKEFSDAWRGNKDEEAA